MRAMEESERERKSRKQSERSSAGLERLCAGVVLIEFELVCARVNPFTMMLEASELYR